MDHPDLRRLGGFSAEQYYQAYRLIMSDEEAAAVVRTLLADLSANTESSIGFDKDDLTLLSLTGEEAATRVRLMLRESPEDAERRQREFLARTQIRQSSG